LARALRAHRSVGFFGRVETRSERHISCQENVSGDDPGGIAPRRLNRAQFQFNRFKGSFMKMFVFAALASALSISSAHANGVEKILANDAHDVQLANAVVGWEPTGEKVISDGIDGPVTETTYTQALEVTVTYKSKDTTDLPTYPGNDGEATTPPGAIPTLYFWLPLTDGEVAGIKAGTIKPATLVQISALTTVSVQVDDANYQYQCSYDNESNQPINGCEEPPIPTHPEDRKAFTIDRK
jgi:hypothetical protein